jgi:hypothetical protein
MGRHSTINQHQHQGRHQGRRVVQGWLISANTNTNLSYNSQNHLQGSPASFRILRQQLSQFKYEDDINYVDLALILFNEMKTRNFKLTEPFEWEKNPDQLNTMSTPRKAEEDLHAHRPVSLSIKLSNYTYRKFPILILGRSIGKHHYKRRQRLLIGTFVNKQKQSRSNRG